MGPDADGVVAVSRARGRLALAALLLATFGLMAWHADQPIVENYVGRQVPTAMVARNLQRGSGFLRPQLDTGPFPNLFLVEPPIYATAVALLGGATGWPIGVSGRVVSALGTTIGAWGLFGLARRREGPAVALIAVVVFATMPVMVRYGRAVQPDALMLGTQLAALRCWDAVVDGGRWRRGWLVAGWCLLAVSLALKVTSAFVLMPLAVGILGTGRKGMIALAGTAILPALLWYAYAAGVLAEGEGSRASLDNGRIWLSALVPTALLEVETYRPAVAFLIGRTSTPIGLALAAFGLLREARSAARHGSEDGSEALENDGSGRGRVAGGPADRLWWAWGGAALLALVALAAKWHHEYYWMVLAPPLSVGIARGLLGVAGLGRLGPIGGAAAVLAWLGLAGLGSASTWRTPAEWRSLPEAAASVRRVVPEGALLVAPEALLFAADRRGCRLETSPSASRRAAGEWGGRLDDPGDPIALVDFYRGRGARYLAVPVPTAGPDPDPRRSALLREARRRYRVLDDRPGSFVAELVPPPDADADGAAHGRRPDLPDAPEPEPEARGRRPGHAPDALPMEAGRPEDRVADGL